MYDPLFEGKCIDISILELTLSAIRHQTETHEREIAPSSRMTLKKTISDV